MSKLITKKHTSNTHANVPSSALAATDAAGVTKDKALNLIEQLVADKADWEQTAYKTSNDLLYSLLQRCYGYYKVMCDDTDDGKAARDALQEYIKRHKYVFKNGTHNITKIVKCVFGADRRRVSAYSIALRTAYANAVPAIEVAKYIAANGGVEEIRLAKSEATLSQADKIQQASAIASSTVLGRLKSADIAMALDISNVGKQIVLLATQGANGELSINAIINSETASKAALVAYYNASKKAAVAAKNVEIAKQPQQAAAIAVDAAVAKLAA